MFCEPRTIHGKKSMSKILVIKLSTGKMTLKKDVNGQARTHTTRLIKT